jgi:hypothetical protein
MRQPLVIPDLGLGLNLHDPQTEIANGQMARALNMLFSRGVMATAYGISQFGSTSLPLSYPVIGICAYQEQGHSPTDHLVAMTTRSLHKWNGVSQLWSDISPATALLSTPDSVPSFAFVPHTDPIAADGTGTDCYYHLLVCDGGESPIYRWAGKFETQFYELAGADGYHETDSSPSTPTKHFAKQVNMFYNHVILLSPKTWDATADDYIENPQAVFWGRAGLLEEDSSDSSSAYDLTKTGAGYVSLVDSGGENVRCVLLGNTLIVYQNNSIWYVYYVGGTTMFLAKCEIPNLGLLAPGLVIPWQNAHYFVGSDYIPRVYQGGSSTVRIADKTFEAIKDDIDPTKLDRCRMTIDARGRRLWIFIVRNGYESITRAYGVDLLTGSWMIRDFDHVFDSDSGLASVALVGGQQYTTGRTWQQDIATAKTYTEAIAEGTTWEQLMNQILISESMVAGSRDGYVYRYDEDLTTDNSVSIPAYGDSKVFDQGYPTLDKQWSTVSITAKGGSTGDSIVLSYRIESFETEDDDWIAFTAISLSDEYETYEFSLDDVTSDQMQLRIANSSGSKVYVKKMTIGEAVLV